MITLPTIFYSNYVTGKKKKAELRAGLKEVSKSVTGWQNLLSALPPSSAVFSDLQSFQSNIL